MAELKTVLEILVLAVLRSVFNSLLTQYLGRVTSLLIISCLSNMYIIFLGKEGLQGV